MTEKGKDQFPPGWDEKRVRGVLDHYESQSDEEAAAEDDTLPGSHDTERTRYELYVREKIARGEKAIAEGRTHTHEEVKERFGIA